MKENNPNWSEQQLKAYALIYCAQADFVETEEERNLITESVDAGTLAAMREEFKQGNDFEHIQKIMNAVKGLGYNAAKRAALVDEMHQLFLCDGKFDRLEKNLLRELKRLL